MTVCFPTLRRGSGLRRSELSTLDISNCYISLPTLRRGSGLKTSKPSTLGSKNAYLFSSFAKGIWLEEVRIAHPRSSRSFIKTYQTNRFHEGDVSKDYLLFSCKATKNLHLPGGNALFLRDPVARYPHQTRDSPRKSEQTDLEEQKMSQNHRKKGGVSISTVAS